MDNSPKLEIIEHTYPQEEEEKEKKSASNDKPLILAGASIGLVILIYCILASVSKPSSASQAPMAGDVFSNPTGAAVKSAQVYGPAEPQSGQSQNPQAQTATPSQAAQTASPTIAPTTALTNTPVPTTTSAPTSTPAPTATPAPTSTPEPTATPTPIPTATPSPTP